MSRAGARARLALVALGVGRDPVRLRVPDALVPRPARARSSAAQHDVDVLQEQNDKLAGAGERSCRRRPRSSGWRASSSTWCYPGEQVYDVVPGAPTPPARRTTTVP